jgi:peptidyl-prolyl cis-trans isomerase SurA
MASRGEVKAAHIMILSRPTDADSTKAVAESKINEIYKKLKAGEKFEDLARQFSEDPSSSRNGGALNWFGVGRMVPEFEEAAFGLKNIGDYSAPVKSAYGWHIIQLLERRGVPSFEESRGDLLSKVERDMRAYTNRSNLVAKLKKEYGLKENSHLLAPALALTDSNLVNGSWKPDEKKLNQLTQTLFSFAGKNYTQKDFLLSLEKNQTSSGSGDPAMIARKYYDSYVEQEIINYEDSRLEDKYVDFKNLMNEYREGILLFDLTDKMVWSKAVQDTAGLKDFYETVKNNHMWGERFEGGIFTCANEDIAKKVRKDVKKGKLSGVEILKKYTKDNPLMLKVEEGKFERSYNEFTGKASWAVGITDDMTVGKSIVFANIKRIIAPEPKQLTEIRGIVTSEYQTQLEKDWIQSLMKKHSIVINEDVVKSIIKN